VGPAVLLDVAPLPFLCLSPSSICMFSCVATSHPSLVYAKVFLGLCIVRRVSIPNHPPFVADIRPVFNMIIIYKHGPRGL
jgi:hypothetical protein